MWRQCTVVALLMAGCGTEGDIERVVAEYASQQPVCEMVTVQEFPATYRGGAPQVGKLDALVSAGVLSRSTVSDGFQYSVSNVGNDSLRRIGGSWGFCFAEYGLVDVVEVSEINERTRSVVFRFEVTEIATWARSDEAAGLENVARTVREAAEGPMTSSVVLVKGGKEWKVQSM